MMLATGKENCGGRAAKEKNSVWRRKEILGEPKTGVCNIAEGDQSRRMRNKESKAKDSFLPLGR
jgi:hypothetical protein